MIRKQNSKKAANTSLDFGNTPPNNAQALCNDVDPEDLKWVDPVVKKRIYGLDQSSKFGQKPKPISQTFVP